MLSFLLDVKNEGDEILVWMDRVNKKSGTSKPGGAGKGLPQYCTNIICNTILFTSSYF